VAITKARPVNKLVGGILATVGIVLLAIGWKVGDRQYTILKSWPSVEAEVTKSQVTQHISHSQNGGDTTMYEARIEFQYSLEDRQFTASSTPGYSTSSYSQMKHMADTYAPGTRHAIRYNPENPNDIRFNAGYSFGFFMGPIILGGMGVLFTGLGIGLLVVGGSSQRLACPACGKAVERGQSFCPNCAAPLPVG